MYLLGVCLSEEAIPDELILMDEDTEVYAYGELQVCWQHKHKQHTQLPRVLFMSGQPQLECSHSLGACLLSSLSCRYVSEQTRAALLLVLQELYFRRSPAGPTDWQWSFDADAWYNTDDLAQVGDPWGTLHTVG